MLVRSETTIALSVQQHLTSGSVRKRDLVTPMYGFVGVVS
jgi:hypothetical protein